MSKVFISLSNGIRGVSFYDNFDVFEVSSKDELIEACKEYCNVYSNDEIVFEDVDWDFMWNVISVKKSIFDTCFALDRNNSNYGYFLSIASDEQIKESKSNV